MFNKLQGSIPNFIFNELESVSTKFFINTPLRMAHFISQCSHESSGFKILRENLNYSETGLKTVFKKYFITVNAKDYARQPEKIANYVYSYRMGNDGILSGDGYRYRGRGAIQLTGKDNYTLFDGLVDDDIVNNPDLVETKYPLLSAAFYWNSRNINKIADLGSSEKVIESVTRLVNGGTIGLEERIELFNKFYGILNSHDQLIVGDRGQEVLYIQELLLKKGVSIKLDGIFGNITKQIVIEFQHKNKLVEDGIVGLKTKQLLEIN